MMFVEFRLDNAMYDEVFFSIIDNLIVLKYGKEVAELINFYIYERSNYDGSSNYLSDLDGKKIPLENAEDLWNLVISTNRNLANG